MGVRSKMIASSEFYKVSSVLLRGVFVTTHQNRKTGFAFKFDWKFWCSVITLMSLSFLQIIFNYRLCTIPETFDLVKFCYVNSCIFYQTMTFGKILSIGFAFKKLNNLFNLLDQIHPKTHQTQTEYKINEWLLETKRLMLRYSFMMIFMIANYLIIPLYTYFNVLIKTGIWKMDLPLEFWLPYQTDKTIPFYLTYLLQSWLGFSASLYLTSADLLLLAIVHLVCVHFDFIRRTFANMKPRPTANDMDIIKRCVVHHNVLIE